MLLGHGCGPKWTSSIPFQVFRCFCDEANPYAVPKNRWVRAWRRFQMNHPQFLFGAGITAAILIFASPFLMHSSNYFTMTKEEYANYCEEVYARNVRLARYGEGFSFGFFKVDLLGKETVKEQEAVHERRVGESKEQADKFWKQFK